MAPSSLVKSWGKSFPTVEQKPRSLIGVNGFWYDVSALIESGRHPGGSIINTFVGKDATDVFISCHDCEQVLKARKPVGTYNRKELRKSGGSVSLEEIERYLAIEDDYQKLDRFFRKNGWYETDYFWLLRQISFVFCVFGTVVLGVYFNVTGDHRFTAILCGVALAGCWQQCGFLMHDFGHSSVFQNRRIDHLLGGFFGSVMLGVPSTWWNFEHNIHHALTNTFSNHDENMNRPDFDIQMLQKSWSQDPQLLKFCDGSYKNKQKFPTLSREVVQRFVKIQHYTFIPLCVFLGRFGIVMDSYTHTNEWSTLVLHWVWMSCLLSMFPSWKLAALFYATASICQGVLHIQLLISHFAEPFEEVEESLDKAFFVTKQVESSVNIINPTYTDWFYGGLNFHIEHHLFTRLPRYRLRQASPYVRDLCAKHNLEYKEGTFLEIVAKVVVHLKQVGDLLDIPDVRKL